ncbi:hypothetical protein HYU06_01885 [Candidatus Woesearchaeota archaeon]|nr:hypothetical protein [Candidatus Woesearchaeota archaeon]
MEQAWREGNIKKSAKMRGLNIDLKIYPSRDVYYSYPSNIALIYELADYKVIYGMLTLQKRINLDKLDLRMHLDYSYSVILSIEQDGLKECTSRDVYSAIRNLVIIHLILQKKVNNILLNNTMKELIGEDILTNLKNETSLLLYKEIGYKILKRQYKLVSKEVKGMNANIKI